MPPGGGTGTSSTYSTMNATVVNLNSGLSTLLAGYTSPSLTTFTATLFQTFPVFVTFAQTLLTFAVAPASVMSEMGLPPVLGGFFSMILILISVMAVASWVRGIFNY